MASETRSAYEDLAALYLPVALAVFAIVCVLLAVVVVRFRAGRRQEPSTRLASSRLELGYAVGLGLVAGVLLWRSLAAIPDAGGPTLIAAAGERPGPAPELTVEVVASRWNWRFTYPGGVSVTGDGRTGLPVLVVPEGRLVRFELRSLDVVHAFWIPALRAKYDALPDRPNVFDLRFEPGRSYEHARCSEFCGEYHDQMRFEVDVRTPADFDAWLRDRAREAP